MRLLILISLIFISSFSKAQLSPNDLLDINWRIIPGVSNKNAYLESQAPIGLGMGTRMSFSGPFDAGRVMVSPTEQVVSVNLKEREFAIMRIADDNKVKWLSPVGGRTIRVGLIADKIIVIHTGDLADRKAKKNVEATVYNLANGKKITNKILYKAPEDLAAETKVFFVKGSEEFYVGLRHTNTSDKVKLHLYGIGASKTAANYMMSSKFELHGYNANLDELSRVDVPIKTNAAFIQAEMNAAREIYMVLADEENSIIVQRISPKHTEVTDSKRINLDLRRDMRMDVDFYVSTVDDKVCFLTFRYKNLEKDKSLSIYRVDFNTGETKSYTEVIDKAYKAKMRAAYNPKYEDAPRLQTDTWGEMEYTGFIEHGDKLIFLKEVMSEMARVSMETNRVSGYYAGNGDGILAVYDQNLKLVNEVAFAKNAVTSGLDGARTVLRAKGNTITIVSPYLPMGFGMNAIIFEYDIEKKDIVKRYMAERGDIRKSHGLVPAATLWFEKSYSIPVLTDRGYYEMNQRMLRAKY
jgi:hypothetical protein